TAQKGQRADTWRAPIAGKGTPPARPRHGNRDGAHHHDEQNSPTDACNRVANRTEAGPDGKTDERGDPAQPGDHTGLLDHSPLRSPPLPPPPPLSLPTDASQSHSTL